MDADTRIEQALRATLKRYVQHGRPPQLCRALEYAVFPGGHRIRPRLCLAVAAACGGESRLAEAAAVAIELLHCASLVHDDLPIFDDAELRRGKPSVHVAFGEPLALLVGDALIVMGFQALARNAGTEADRLGPLVEIIGGGVGMPFGIVAGQAWESEPAGAALGEYHRQKTGALFAAATMAGAAAAGAPHESWSRLGECIGEAYQAADDLLDRYGDPDVIGKPVGRDDELDRPNSVARLGFSGVNSRLRRLVDGAAESIPACPGQAALKQHIEVEAGAFIRAALSRRCAA